MSSTGELYGDPTASSITNASITNVLATRLCASFILNKYEKKRWSFDTWYFGQSARERSTILLLIWDGLERFSAPGLLLKGKEW